MIKVCNILRVQFNTLLSKSELLELNLYRNTLSEKVVKVGNIHHIKYLDEHLNCYGRMLKEKGELQ